MNQVGDVERKAAGTANPSGFIAQTWQKIHVLAPCRVQPYKFERISEFQRLGMKVTHRIHFYPPLSGIKEGDRILILGIYYSVKGSMEPDLMGLFSVVDAERITS